MLVSSPAVVCVVLVHAMRRFMEGTFSRGVMLATGPWNSIVSSLWLNSPKSRSGLYHLFLIYNTSHVFLRYIHNDLIIGINLARRQQTESGSFILSSLVRYRSLHLSHPTNFPYPIRFRLSFWLPHFNWSFKGDGAKALREETEGCHRRRQRGCVRICSGIPR